MVNNVNEAKIHYFCHDIGHWMVMAVVDCFDGTYLFSIFSIFYRFSVESIVNGQQTNHFMLSKENEIARNEKRPKLGVYSIYNLN